MLINPLQPAIETWLALWSCLPLVVRLLATLTLGLFSAVVLFKLFYNMRGGH